MPVYRSLRLGAFAVSAAVVAACSSGFKVSRYPTNDGLFKAALAEFNRRKWDNAVTAFEKLTFDLPARDTLAPLAHWYLAKAHSEREEHLLSAQAFLRLAESFSTDSMADDAVFQAGKEYQQLWRRPQLDAQYGDHALSTYQQLLGLYPDSELRDEANREIERLQEWFAAKDYESGMYYYRRKAFDSAIIYFKDVVKNYSTTAKSREALLRLAGAYDAIRYREDKKDVCATLHEKYPTDKEVMEVCGVPAATLTNQARPDTSARRDSL